MRKILFLFMLVFASFTSVVAQDHFDLQRRSEFSVGLEVAVPMNGWDIYVKDTKSADFGVGISLKYAYNFNHFLAATFQPGYIYFPGKDMGALKVNSGQFFLKAGLRLKAGQTYLEPQFGISSFKGNIPPTASGVFLKGPITPFTYAVGIGTLAVKNLDLGLRYEAMKRDATVGYMALRIGYRIPLGDD